MGSAPTYLPGWGGCGLREGTVQVVIRRAERGWRRGGGWSSQGGSFSTCQRHAQNNPEPVRKVAAFVFSAYDCREIARVHLARELRVSHLLGLFPGL